MEIFSSNPEVNNKVREWRRNGDRIGFVPTMGNLHAGHLRLIERIKPQTDRVIVSIYVNPLQFGPNEDFDNYPRTLDADREKLDALNIDLLFTPNDASMYPHGTKNCSYVDAPSFLTEGLEGAHRRFHFRGVTTVVMKLFNIVMPDVAIFGEKDFQQLLIISQMVRDFNLPIDILAEPTVREADGLALSSRNQYLSKQERLIAPKLYATLNDTRQRIQMRNMDLVELEQEAIMRLERLGFAPDYVAIRNADTLAEPDTACHNMVILAAARLGKTRLIDNLRV